MNTKILPILAALVLAAMAYAVLEPFNHPVACDNCHTYRGTNPAVDLTFTTGGTGTCDPTKQECVWSHNILTGESVWQQCTSCHGAIHRVITAPGNVHKDLQENYPCACHAVAHVGYGNVGAGLDYVACVYMWILNLTGTSFWGEAIFSGYELDRVRICFKGDPTSIEAIRFEAWSSNAGNWTAWTSAPTTFSTVKILWLNVTAYQINATHLSVKSSAGYLLPSDHGEPFFALFEYTKPIFRFAIVGKGNMTSHSLTEVPPEYGETIVMGVFDIHDGTFILPDPYFSYQRYPYYAPAGNNPAWSACFNCHFTYEGQVGTAKVMNVGGLWKIAIPTDALQLITNPHAIVMPTAGEAGGVAPNLTFVALIATATLLGGAFIALRRRL